MTSVSLTGRAPMVPGRSARRVATFVTAAGLALVLTACSPSSAPGTAVDTPALAAGVARTDPAAPEAAPARLDVVPAAGTVVHASGPFDDRVAVHDLTVVDGRVTGSLDVVSDVSELIALEIEVAWYDAEGSLVGSTREVVDPEVAEGFHTPVGIAGLPIDVATPGATSARLTIPVLVNE